MLQQHQPIGHLHHKCCRTVGETKSVAHCVSQFVCECFCVFVDGVYVSGTRVLLEKLVSPSLLVGCAWFYFSCCPRLPILSMLEKLN